MKRVLLIGYHVTQCNSAVVRAGQRLVEPLTLRFQTDHLAREPLELLRAEGMEIKEVHRWAWGIMERVSARKPGQA